MNARSCNHSTNAPRSGRFDAERKRITRVANALQKGVHLGVNDSWILHLPTKLTYGKSVQGVLGALNLRISRAHWAPYNDDQKRSETGNI